jgi:arginase
MLTARHSGDELYRYTAHPKTCTIIGAPMTYGQPYIGTDFGPTLLRKAGLLQKLSALSWRIDDRPDLDFANLPSSGTATATVDNSPNWGNAKNRWQVSAGAQMLATTVEETLRQGRFPLILGGDHSVGIGSLAGILKAHGETGVLWIDAHADINTPAISESGNMHGMPVGLLMQGVASPGIPAMEWLDAYPKLKPHQIVYVGLRDVDVEERKIINGLGIVAYTMTEIDRYGIGKVMDMALDHLAGRRLHLSYDIDAIDPVLAPATGTAVRGGLTFREAHYVAEAVAATGRLASAEIVELNPTLSNVEGAANTVDLGLQIIASLMGNSII